MTTSSHVNGFEVQRSARLSQCGRYRYWLRRFWAPNGPTVAFVGLNPSTADAEHDDPTIRRCVRFAQDWGYGSLLMVNLFALRSTDPRLLGRADINPTGGEEHLRSLDRSLRNADLVVGAWGADPMAPGRADHLQQLRVLPKRYAVLGLTEGGQPRHPLYMPADSRPVWSDDRTDVVVPSAAWSPADRGQLL